MLYELVAAIIFAPLLATGVETIENVPGTSGGYGNSIIHTDWTHALVGALVLAALFGLVAARPWGRRAGVVLAEVVFSHWLLDLVVHRADMPILPATPATSPGSGSACGRPLRCRSWSSWPWSWPAAGRTGAPPSRLRRPTPAGPTWSASWSWVPAS
jgi:hypothetical protein